MWGIAIALRDAAAAAMLAAGIQMKLEESDG
jgi:hypothetical protein